MNQTCVGCVLGTLASTVIAGAALSAAPKGIEIQTEDVTRFYKVYEAAGGHPSAEQLQRDYLDPGTPGLHHLAKVRNVTAERIAQAIETNPELYTDARTCIAALPRVRERLDAAFRQLLISTRRLRSRRSRSPSAEADLWRFPVPATGSRLASRRCARPLRDPSTRTSTIASYT
jgi:hypothetical protein